MFLLILDIFKIGDMTFFLFLDTFLKENNVSET